MVTLRDADARAVDLLLDRAAAAQGDGGTAMTTTFAGQAGGASGERVAAAEKVLRLLDALSAGEPAPDLLRRTLARLNMEPAPLLPIAGDVDRVGAQPVA